MKADGLERAEMIEGIMAEFDVTEEIAGMLLSQTNKTQEAPKKSIMDVFKSKPDSKSSYTAPGYEVQPGESNAVHMEVEQRNFEPRSGKRMSKPRTLKIDVVDWPHWYQRRGGQGFEINKVFHRPASIAPIQIDDWEEKEVDGKIVGENKGEIF